MATQEEPQPVQHYPPSESPEPPREEQCLNNDYDQLIVNRRGRLLSELHFLKTRRYLLLSLVTISCLVALLLGLSIMLIIHDYERLHPDSKPNKKDPFPGSFSFFHLSDLHIDLYFDPDVGRAPTFCRNNFENVTPAAANFPARYGRVGCDSPRSLIDSMVQSMKYVYNASHPNTIKFIVMSGDMSGHALDRIMPYNLGPFRTLEAIRYATHAVFSNFSHIPFYPCIGNNDLAGDYLLPENKTFFEDILRIWAPGILCMGCSYSGTTSKELNSTFLKGGYYKVSLHDSLSLIVMNTVYWSTKATPQDPAIISIANEQMEWVIRNLRDAFAKGTKVILMGHIPPSMDPYSRQPLWHEMYLDLYVQNVASVFKDQVIAQLFGHLHKDAISIQRSAEFPHTRHGDVGDVLLAPAVSPVYRNNPAYRLVKADAKGAIVDYQQYYMDLVLSTEFKLPSWRMEYTFREIYKDIIGETETISPIVLSRLVEKLIDPNATSEVWQAYNSHRQTGYQLDPFDRFNIYCSAKHVRQNAYKQCLKSYNVTGG